MTGLRDQVLQSAHEKLILARLQEELKDHGHHVRAIFDLRLHGDLLLLAEISLI